MTPATSDGQERESALGFVARSRALLSSPRSASTLAALLAILVSAYLYASQQDAAELREVKRLRESGRPDSALTLARAVERAPFEAGARLEEAYALLALGRTRDASRAFRHAARRDPNNWTLQRDWAIALRWLGDRDGASRRMARALELNPRMGLPEGFVAARPRGSRQP